VTNPLWSLEDMVGIVGEYVSQSEGGIAALNADCG